MINRSYLQQVAMIESECEPRKKQPMISNYSKSPLRDRESIVSSIQIGWTLETLPEEVDQKLHFPHFAREELNLALLVALILADEDSKSQCA